MTATSFDNPRQQKPDVVRRSGETGFNEPSVTERQPAPASDGQYVTVPVAVLDALTTQLAAKDEQIRRRDEQLEKLVDAHDSDRQLLGAALAIIHKDDFALSPANHRNPPPASATEIKPEIGHDRGNP